MSVEIVEVAPEDGDAFVRATRQWWGEPEEEDPSAVRKALDRMLYARLEGESCGAAATIDFTIAMPGGSRLRMDGVTEVVVAAPSRRQGALTAMMSDMLEHARARGVPLLGLGASESLIYRRFGYGPASHIGLATIDTAHAALREVPGGAGRIRQLPLSDAVPMWLDVEARQRQRVGALDRSEASWRRLQVHGATPREGKSPLQVATHTDGAGVVDGYVNYRLEHRWPEELADGTVHVSSLSALNLEAHLALWRHVLEQDLMEHLRFERFWLDDPILHLLRDSRRMRVVPRDDLHLRIADVAAVLAGRRYSREDSLVIELRDDAAPDIAGRYRLEGGLDGATAERTGSACDVVLDAPTLASLVLGDVSAATLHAAGLVDERTPGAVRRAAAMFAWSPRPWLTYMF